ncbi:MAG TPA: proton-conducting transporter membrane subunit [Lentimicrobium sp.]|jgi:hydrogenase-4 component F|nr:proton-conducting transporter membrane subunit [Lentimicrobium sp.]
MIGTFLTASLIIGVWLFVNKSAVINYALVTLFCVLLTVTACFSYLHLNETHWLYFTTDAPAVLLLCAIAIVSIPAFYHGYRYISLRQESPGRRGLFFAAMVLLITACSMVYLSNHLAVSWIFVELTTLSASALIYHHRNIRALEGVWKYVFLCAISITFIYVGILFLSLSLKQAGINDMSFKSLYENSRQLNPFWLKLSFLFIFTGFTAKLGLVPMYTAGIDAKDKAPAPAGALLASVLMNVGFISIYRMYGIMAGTPLKAWANTIMIIAALLTIFVAAVYMTRVKNLKRLFAYSGIEHMGIAILGLAAGGVGVYAAFLHIILHTFIKPGLFFQFSMVYRVFQSKSIYDMGNYFKYYKAGAIAILLGFFSVTAMPPSGLFISELMVFQSLIESHRIVILLVLLLLLTIIIWGFGVNIFKLLFTPAVGFVESKVPNINPWESLSQYVLIVLSVYLAYNPPAEFVMLFQQSVNLIR